MRTKQNPIKVLPNALIRALKDVFYGNHSPMFPLSCIHVKRLRKRGYVTLVNNRHISINFTGYRALFNAKVIGKQKFRGIVDYRYWLV